MNLLLHTQLNSTPQQDREMALKARNKEIHQMRYLILPVLLVTTINAWADVHAANPLNPIQWHTECLGRTQFEVPGDIEWHVAGGRWNYPEFGIYSPNIDPSDKQLSYGNSPFNKNGYLFDIEVSPVTTLAIFQQFKNRHGPDIEGAQSRVIEKKIDSLKQKLTWDLEQSNPEKFNALKAERYALEEAQVRLSKLYSETVLLNELIDDFDKNGRPTEKLRTELQGYQKELSTYPTDSQYEQEHYIDWNIVDAQITWTSGKLIALLWRNERIYRFTFNSKNSGNNTQQTLETITPKALEVLRNFRPRQQFEVPLESGFCLPFGFISDNGTENYAITLAWHPIKNPSLLYSLNLSNNIDKSLKLLPLLTSAMFTNPFPNSVELNRFGPESTKIGNIDGVIGGSRYRGVDPDTGKREASERFTLTAGHTNTENRPELVLKVESFANGQPLGFEDVKEQLLRTLKSVRPLPGITQ
jgi:hypothetical protein